MRAKPKHLDPEYAAVFRDRSVVDAYHYRPTYPSEVFGALSDLIADEPRVVLDAGCGTGAVARHLVDYVDRVDALDVSEAMIETGKTLPQGNNPRLRWLLGAAEDAELDPPYALITAGQSLHWMDWKRVMPRFASLLSTRGYLAIVGIDQASNPWDAELGGLFPRFSTNKDYRPYDLLEELTSRGLFERRGEYQTEYHTIVQPIEHYVESFHARNGLSRERMELSMAAAFDAEVRILVAPHAWGQDLELQIRGRVVWGKPIDPRAGAGRDPASDRTSGHSS